MPDKPIEPGSITQTADVQDERISEVSSVANTVREMQRDVDQRLTEVEQQTGDTEGIAEVQTATIGILQKMKDTMGSFAQGINAITLGTAAATKDAIGQYGKAISEDISYNKQSVVAMALSRSTPIFGYFAAKFMETDVFQKAKAKMADSLKSVFSGIGKTIGGFFKGKKEAEEIPKMQRGGYVQKGGMVEVHAGEIVAPIEKVLSRVDESIGAVQEIGVAFKRAQLKSMANLAGYVKGQERLEKVGIFKGFLRAMNQVQTQYEEPAQIRMLRALLAIQDSLGATMGTMEQVWTKMLVEHPTFRNIVFSLRGLSSALSLPGRIAYTIFKARGGYKGHLPNVKNPFENMSIILGMIYAEGMHRLDNIALYTRATAEATRDISTYQTGKKYPPLAGIPRGFWSIVSIGRKMLNLGAKWLPPLVGGTLDIFFGGTGGSGWKKGKTIGNFLTKERETFLNRWMDKLSEMGRSGMIEHGVYGKGGLVEAYKNGQEEIPTEEKPIPVKLIEYNQDIIDAEYEVVKEKEKQSSDLISGVNNLYDGYEKQYKIQKKQAKTGEKMAKDLDQMNKRGKFKMIWGMITGGLGKIGGLFKDLIGGALGWLGLKAGGLKHLMSGVAFAKFLGPVAGVLVAAGLGVAIGTWLNTYIGPWLDKKWQEAEARNRREAAKHQLTLEESMRKAKTTAGIKGLGEKYKVKLGQQAINIGYEEMGNDSKISLVYAGQQEIFNENISKYLKYPLEKLGPWRREWQTDYESLYGAIGSRGWFADPLKYGRKRETMFLTWLNKNKADEMRTEGQVQAAGEAWTAKHIKAGTAAGKEAAASGLASMSHEERRLAGKGTTVREKIEQTAAEISDIAGEYVTDAQAKAAGTAKALQDSATKTKEALDNLGASIQETIGQQSTVLTNSVMDASQKIVNTGGAAATNAYQDVKKTVLTGKVDADYLQLDIG